MTPEQRDALRERVLSQLMIAMPRRYLSQLEVHADAIMEAIEQHYQPIIEAAVVEQHAAWLSNMYMLARREADALG